MGSRRWQDGLGVGRLDQQLGRFWHVASLAARWTCSPVYHLDPFVELVYWPSSLSRTQEQSTDICRLVWCICPLRHALIARIGDPLSTFLHLDRSNHSALSRPLCRPQRSSLHSMSSIDLGMVIEASIGSGICLRHRHFVASRQVEEQDCCQSNVEACKVRHQMPSLMQALELRLLCSLFLFYLKLPFVGLCSQSIRLFYPLFKLCSRKRL
jgi:hypothetical protein